MTSTACVAVLRQERLRKPAEIFARCTVTRKCLEQRRKTSIGDRLRIIIQTDSAFGSFRNHLMMPGHN